MTRQGNRQVYKLDHCTYCCKYHLVWCPKYRGKVLSDTYIKQELRRMFNQIAQWKGLELLECGIEDDHLHLYMVIPPKYSISYTMRILKEKTSKWLKKKTKKFPPGAFWQKGYFVSTVGIHELAIKRYIENQWKHQVEFKKLPL